MEWIHENDVRNVREIKMPSKRDCAETKDRKQDKGKQGKIELKEAGQDKLRQDKDDEAQRDSGIRKECEGGRQWGNHIS
ncbi:hypothetical protein WR25_07551 [Diploscapter pachys]|uniref:Uncharacterized protein n=1 Tax=Diploscapter pachys TaxID=2018661 RepID=A0A2A2JS13_9BILA|nr:hypothetical protein WR25_07551 [Diploscapter pachys]